jgi:hypothetical protein
MENLMIWVVLMKINKKYITVELLFKNCKKTIHTYLFIDRRHRSCVFFNVIMQVWRNCQVLSGQAIDSSAFLNAMFFKVCIDQTGFIFRSGLTVTGLARVMHDGYWDVGSNLGRNSICFDWRMWCYCQIHSAVALKRPRAPSHLVPLGLLPKSVTWDHPLHLVQFCDAVQRVLFY